MGGYPDGCTQATHDRAFNELGPSPEEADVTRFTCGHYGREEDGTWLGEAKVGGEFLCDDCYERRVSEAMFWADHLEAQDKIKAFLLKWCDPKPEYSGITAHEIAGLLLKELGKP